MWLDKKENTYTGDIFLENKIKKNYLKMYYCIVNNEISFFVI